MSIERKCPACGQAVGLARRVSTVPRRHDIVTVVMVCGNCSHEWSAEFPCLSLSTSEAIGQSVEAGASPINEP